MKQVPSQNEYQKAQETVKQFEERQQQLANVNKELGYKLQQFNSFNFKVNKKNREIMFAGYLESDNKVKMSISKCKPKDKWEESIGKLIAVKKALGEDISEIVELVEVEKSFIGIKFIKRRDFLDGSFEYVFES